MTAIRSFVLLCLTGWLCFISYNLVRTPVLPLFAESLGAGAAQVGILVSLSTVTGVFFKLPVGALSDLIGRRLLLFGGLLAFALPPFAYLVTDSLVMLGGLRLVHGLATAIFTPVALALVAELFLDRRGEAFGWYFAATQGGALIGPLLGGWLVSTQGFASAFLVGGIIGSGSLLVFWWIPAHLGTPLEEQGPAFRPGSSSRGEQPSADEGRGVWQRVRSLAQDLRIWSASLTNAAEKLANGALLAFLPLYGLSIGLTAAEVGVLFTVQGLASLLAKPFVGRLADAVGRRPLIVGGLALCAITFSFIPHVTDMAGLVVLAVGFGGGEAVVSASAAALIADLSARDALGGGMGLRGTIMDLGHAGGPLLAGVLIAVFNYQAAFAVIGAIQLFAAGLFWMVLQPARARVL